jgi:hypothetical protein
MAVEVEPSRPEFVSFFTVQQIAAEEQSGKMAPDMEVRKKQKYVIEFLHAEKNCTRRYSSTLILH